MAPITHRLRTILKLPLLAAVFVVLCVWQSVALPIFEAQDEASHFKYADYLARTWRLPDLRGELPSHEASQPPLYYLAVAAIIAPIDRSDIASHTQINEEHTDLSLNPDHTVPRTKYWYLHIAPQAWPYQGAVLAAHLARLFSVVLGLITLALSGWIARQLIVAARRHKLLTWLDAGKASWLASVLIAFNPKFVHLSSVINNDIAVACMTSIACAWLLHIWPRAGRDAHWREAATAGVFSGLAVLCKLNGLAISGMLAWMLLGVARKRGWRAAVPLALAAGAAFALTAGVWFGHNTLAYGNPLAWAETRVAHTLEQRALPLAPVEVPGAAFEFVLSIWSQIGWLFNFDAAINLWPLLGLCLALAGVLGLFWRNRRAVRRIPFTQSPLAGIVVWGAGTLAMFAPWFIQYEGTSNARLMMTLLAPATVLLVIGWHAAGRLLPRMHPALVGIQPIALLAWIGLSIATPAYFLPAAYAAPTLVTAQKLDRDATFGTALEMRGSQATYDGANVRLHTLLGASAPISRSYRIELEVIDSTGETIGQLRALPASGGYSTLRWPAGRHFEDTFVVPLTRQPIGQSTVRVGWYFRSRAEPALAYLPIEGTKGTRLDVRVDGR